ncbi:ABC transporter permease [Actinoplanes sp. L3-i22]|uniref:ABC transporter permease n=1 Tax=Actinoplanes sp. L3-i22 TaxID=2836373 RepID=UPI001C74D61D|nr:ABC transporter permease [Actinoplanes sp. L3-i22]BCY07944.1 ribose ABC transporter permease [Actinoplanes sp. L3-i22]
MSTSPGATAPAAEPAAEPTAGPAVGRWLRPGLHPRALLARPEVGALAAAVVIFLFFLLVAPSFRSFASFCTVLYQSSTIGIVAVGVGLLMIGGEFDLSAGVITTSAGLVNSMFCWYFGVNLWVGAVLSLGFCLLVGFLNGWLVMRTGIPSFLITLGTFFVLQGANLGVTKLVTGSVSSRDISAIDGFDSLRKVFASSFTVGPATVWITVLWWALFVGLAAWILQRARTGNWIYAVGGSADSARAVGVPVVRTKIGLFMAVSFLGWFVGMHLLYRFNTLQAGNGVGNEFLYIIAAVVGGTLLTGGFGNALGVAIGAFIFGMTSLGIVYAGWDPNWFKAFLGVMLLLAVLVNTYVKRLATSSTRFTPPPPEAPTRNPSPAGPPPAEPSPAGPSPAEPSPANPPSREPSSRGATARGKED